MSWNNELNKEMPVLFIGHGNPMNAIDETPFSLAWKQLAEELPRPQAILCISAHWLTRGKTSITTMSKPRTIHDFGGFPQELFEVQYPAPGCPELAQLVREQVRTVDIEADDNEWGLDHGAWSVLINMYPEADIPIVQLSIDYHKTAAFHYELGKELAFLRKKGVLILGSGNIVHNLRVADFRDMPAYDWCERFDLKSRDLILENNHEALINYETLGKDALMAIPTPDHYYPLMYILALQEKADKVSFPVTGLTFRSGSMRSVLYEH
jgi:4,5-DOPA dioxygenase extradiol